MVSIKDGLAGLILATGLVFSSNANAQNLSVDSIKNKLYSHYIDLKSKYGVGDRENVFIVDGKTQTAYLVCQEDSVFEVVDSYDVSTGKNGYGNSPRSYKTPLGVHKIEGKMGQEQK